MLFGPKDEGKSSRIRKNREPLYTTFGLKAETTMGLSPGGKEPEKTRQGMGAVEHRREWRRVVGEAKNHIDLAWSSLSK